MFDAFSGLQFSHLYAAVCVAALLINWRVGEHRTLSIIVTLFAALAWLIHAPVKAAFSGPYWYLFWSFLEALMMASQLVAFRLLRYSFTLHLLILLSGSLLFVFVTLLRMTARYYGFGIMSKSVYLDLTMVTYLIYSFVMLMPGMGWVLLRIASAGKGSLYDPIVDCFEYCGSLCLHGDLRFKSFRP